MSSNKKKNAQIDSEKIVAKLEEWSEVSRNVANKMTGNNGVRVIHAHMNEPKEFWMFGNSFAVKDLNDENVTIVFCVGRKSRRMNNSITATVPVELLVSTDVNGIAANARSMIRKQLEVLHVEREKLKKEIEKNYQKIKELEQKDLNMRVAFVGLNPIEF